MAQNSRQLQNIITIPINIDLDPFLPALTAIYALLQGRTREQQLRAIHYALWTLVSDKNGRDKLIPTNAAAINVGCTAKMLRT